MRQRCRHCHESFKQELKQALTLTWSGCGNNVMGLSASSSYNVSQSLRVSRPYSSSAASVPFATTMTSGRRVDNLYPQPYTFPGICAIPLLKVSKRKPSVRITLCVHPEIRTAPKLQQLKVVTPSFSPPPEKVPSCMRSAWRRSVRRSATRTPQLPTSTISDIATSYGPSYVRVSGMRTAQFRDNSPLRMLG